MVKRRRGPPARPSAARHAGDKAGVISAVPPADALAEAQADHGPEGLPEMHATPDHAPSVHETLLETVSPEAIDVAAGEPISAHAVPTESPEPVDEPAATVSAADEASAPESTTFEATAFEDAIAEVSDTTDVPPPATERPEAVESVADAAPRDDIALPAPLAAVPATVARSSRSSLDMIGAFADANATLLAFFRSEGNAAMAHWQSLSGAKTPADLLRIQVDEMQRAADASLTCFSALARRAGRLASGIGRI